MGSCQMGQGIAHSRKVQRFRNMPGVMLQHGTAHWSVQNPVAIGFLADVEAGMEVICDAGCIQYGDIPGKTGVQRCSHACFRYGGKRSEVTDLPMGMDTGIRPSGAVNSDRSFVEKRQGLLQAPLYGSKPGLDLPAAKARSVIAHREPVGYSAVGRKRLPMMIAVAASMKTVAHRSLPVNFKVFRRVRFSPPR